MDMAFPIATDRHATFAGRFATVLCFGLLAVSAVTFMVMDSLSVFAVSPPNIVSYQGRILNANGVPVADPTANMQFRLWDSLAGGTCLWSNDDSNCASNANQTVTLTDGLFSENLGDTVAGYAAIPDSVFADNATIYLEVEVEGETLAPRKLMTAAPFALNADTLDGLDSTDFAVVGSAFVQNGNSFGAPAVLGTNDTFPLSFETDGTTKVTVTTAGDVGIGDTTPDALLDVAGSFQNDGSSVFGDAGADTVTSNAAAWTFANDTTVALTGGVNGLNFDSNTLSIDATNNRVGIGTAAPADALDIQGAADTTLRVKTTAGITDAALELDRNVQGNARSVIRLLTGGVTDWFVGMFNYGNLDPGGSDLQLSSTGQSDGNSQFTFTKTGRFGVGNDDPQHAISIGVSASPLEFEGATADAFETVFAITDPTADRTITFQNASGTVAFLSDITGGTETLQQAYDADADGGDATITTNATDGDIVFAGDQDFRVTTTGNSIFDTTTLVVDSTNDRVGIGTATPATALNIVTAGASTVAQVQNTTTTGVGRFIVRDDGGINNINLKMNGSATAGTFLGYAETSANYLEASPGGGAFHIRNTSAFPTVMSANGVEGLTITSAETVVNEAANAYNFRVETASAPLAFLVDATANDVIVNEGSSSVVNFRVEGDNNANLLFTDATNDRIGIGTATPATVLNIVTAGASTVAQVQNTSTTGLGRFIIRDDGGSNFISMRTNGSGVGGSFLGYTDSSSNYLETNGSGGAFFIRNAGSTPIVMSVADGEKLTLKTTEVVVNEAASGTVDFRAEGVTDANLLFVDASSNRVGVGTAAPAHQFEVVSSNRKVGLNNSLGASEGGIIGFSRPDDGAYAFHIGVGATANDPAVIWNNGGNDMRVITNFGPINFYAQVAAFGAGTAFGSAIPANPTVHFDATQSVGMGTATPTDNITVVTKVLDVSSGGTTAITLHDTATAQESEMVTNGAGMFFDVAGHATATNNDIIFRTGETDGSYTVQERLRLDATAEAVFNDASDDYDFRIESDTDANAFFIDAGNSRIGFGTSTPSAKFDQVYGTLADGQRAIATTATLPSGSSDQEGTRRAWTTSAGSDAHARVGSTEFLDGAFTGDGTNVTLGYQIYNTVAGTANDIEFDTSFTNPKGNSAFNAFAAATTTGLNIAGYGEALGGNVSVGFVGKAITAKASATNIGVIGDARNSGGSGIEVGGYFGLNTTTPTFTSAALMADNGATTSPIFVARDNGTPVFTIADGGAITTTGDWNVNGNTTLGDAGADSVTSNAATWSFPNDTAVSLGGGVNGLNFDSNTLSIDATNNRVGIGTAAPGTDLEVNRSANSAVRVDVINANAGAAATAFYRAQNDVSNALDMGIRSSTFVDGSGVTAAGDAFVMGNATALDLAALGDGNEIKFIRRSTGGTVVEAARATFSEFVVNEGSANYDFRVEGDTDPNLLFTDASTDRVAIGTATPGAKLSVIAGNMTDDTSTGASGIFFSGTLQNTSVGTNSQAGMRLEVTGNGGGSTSKQAFMSILRPGYTGSGVTIGGDFENLSAGAGNNLHFNGLSNPSGNSGINGFSYGTTATGLNIGSYAAAANGLVNVGAVGASTDPANGGTNIGAIGTARNTGTTPTEIGGYFGLFNTTPAFDASAGLIASNGATTNSIFLARDNNTTVFTIADGGTVTVAGNILPSTDDTFTLGDDTHRWADIFLGPATAHVGTSTGDEGSISYNTSTNVLGIDSTGSLDLMGGSGSTGCSVDASGNFGCSGTVSGGGGSWTLDGTSQTVTADKNMTLAGGVNGFSFDNTTFSVDATNDRIGFGTTTPASTIDAVAAQTGAADITSYNFTVNTSGSGSNFIGGLGTTLAGSFTGSGFTVAGYFYNQLTGTNTTYGSNAEFGYLVTGNRGVEGLSTGTTAGHNVGGLFIATRGDKNYGSWSSSTVAKSGGTNVGVIGFGLNTGGGGAVQVGGYFSLFDGSTSAPTIGTSAALIANNGSQTSDIFSARDNGTKVLSVIDGGALEVAEITAPGTPSSGFGRIYEKSDNLLYFKNDAGTEFDLTAVGGGGGATTIGDAVTGGGANRVLYEDASQDLAASANLQFDGTAVGIGGTPQSITPEGGSNLHLLEIQTSQDLNFLTVMKNSNSGTLAQTSYRAQNNVDSVIDLTMNSTTATPVGIQGSGMGSLYTNSPQGLSIIADSTGPIYFAAGGTAQMMELDTTGRFGIGRAPTQMFDLYKSTNGFLINNVTNDNSGTSAQADFQATNDTGKLIELGIWSSTHTPAGALSSGDSFVYSDSPGLNIMAGAAGGVIKLSTGGTTERMRIDASGNVGIGDTTPTEALLVVGSSGSGDIFATFASSANTERLCWDASGASLITDCSGSPGDYAEQYGSYDSTVEAGDVVAMDAAHPAVETVRDGLKGSKAFVVKAGLPYAKGLLGVISTQPNETIGQNFTAGENAHPVALNGRVPVKVSTENGAIEVGDPLTASELHPGYAMKATDAGMIVGYALEPSSAAATDASAKILMFVHTGYSAAASPNPNAGTSNQASSLSGNLSSLNMSGNIYMAGNRIIDVDKISGLNGVWSVDSTGKFTTQGSYDVVIKSYQNEEVTAHALLSTEHKLFLSGTAELVNGEATVSFEAVDPNFNDVISTSAPMQVVTTPNGPAYVYVAAKDHNGFSVKQLNGADSGITFDWMVTAYRKDHEPAVAAPTETPADPAPVVDAPPADEPPADAPVVETPPTDPAPPASPETPPVDPTPSSEEPPAPPPAAP